MSAGTLASRILGLVRDRVIASNFDLTVTDSFFVAFRLPNMFRRLLGEGSLSASFIPIYSEVKEKQGEAEAARLSGQVLSVLVLVLMSLCAFAITFMDQLIPVMVSGGKYAQIAGKVEQTVSLARWMFGYLFLVSIYAYFMAILQSNKRFFLAALAPAFFNLAMVIFAIWPTWSFGVTGLQLAIGVLVGGVVQTGVVFYELKKLKIPLGFVVPSSSKALRQVFVNMIPGMIGGGLLQLMSVANLYFASSLPEGAHSYIYYADRILEFPQSLIAISLGVALLPRLSDYFARSEFDEMKREGVSALESMLFLAMPCSFGMYFLAEPIVNLLFLSGEFRYEQAQATAEVIRIYSYLLVASSFVKVLVPNFYAIKNTWVPAVCSVIAFAFHLVLAPILLADYKLEGLVASTVTSGYVNMVMLLVFYHVHLGAFPYLRLFRSVAQFLVPNAVMAGWLWYATVPVSGLLTHWFHGLTYRVVVLVVMIGVAGVLFFVASTVMGIPQAKAFLALFRRKLGRRS